MTLDELKNCIIRYAGNKSDLDDLEKVCNAENIKIKECMRDNKLSTYPLNALPGEYIANYSVQNRESMNEEMLISSFHENWEDFCKQHHIIKTRECIDYDALEKAIYDGVVSADMLSAIKRAKETKRVEVLKISKMKEKK